jgi:3-carboxy-cis,cis-muconate cycloisomerase
MPARLIESLATTDPLADLFSDRSLIQAMLDFEAALARAEAGCGVVPQAAADAIAATAKAGAFDAAALAHDSLRAGTYGLPLAKALTERVRASNPDAARFVHWGATSQDVADTALVLLLKQARSLVEADLTRVQRALRHLAEQHGKTPMLGRTLMQAAPPVTFGLKAAGWLGAMVRDRRRLNAAFDEALVVQFGGASGTLAALGERGPAVGRALAKELGLTYPEAPWHAQRDRLAALVCACGILTGSLGKMARDISLLMQGEVAEAAEPGGDGRGGSSTMPQKRNPIACALALAAANRVPGLVCAFLSGMVQEHERGVGGWQAEWPTVAGVIQATGLAVASMTEVSEGLTVDEARMRANIQSTRGAVFAEKAMMLLGERLGRDVAHKLLEEATRKSAAQGLRLADVLAEMPEVKNHIEPAVLQQLEAPEHYLGAAEEFRTGLLGKRNTSE